MNSAARLALLAVVTLQANGFSVPTTARRVLTTKSQVRSLPYALRRSQHLALRSTSPDADPEVAAMQAEAEKLRAEVKELEATVQQSQEKVGSKPDARSMSFNAFDKNQDGVVDLLELKTGLFDKFGLVCEDSELQSVMQMFDENKDGVLQVGLLVEGLNVTQVDYVV